MNELISMSPHELSRTEVMQQLKTKQITQAQAAEHLNLTVRHASRSACGEPTGLEALKPSSPSGAASPATTAWQQR